MGRVKTAFIKRITKQLVAKYRKEFSSDYFNNKEVVAKAVKTTKKIRNIIAGYATRLMKAGY